MWFHLSNGCHDSHIHLYFIECKILIVSVKKSSSILELLYSSHDLRLNMYFVDFVSDSLPRGSLIKLLWFNGHNFCEHRIEGSGDYHTQSVV